MRKRINALFAHAKKRWAAVWKWGERPKGSKRRLNRFRALVEWAKARSRKAGDKFADAARGYAKRVRRLAKRLRKRHHGLGSVDVTTSPGDPHWGGGNDVMRQFVEPFMVKRGLPVGSGKRTPEENARVGGSPTSDHLTTHTTTMARDFPTYSGEDDARALAHALGFDGWAPNSYATFNVQVDDHTFRVQILWGASIGHSDHVHVGVGLVA